MSASSKAKAGNVDLGTIVKGFEGAYEQAVRDLGRFNLVIFGETGVGKSTLVNAIFGKDVAEAGAGRPVTKSTDYYEHPSGVLGIYDTKGIETGRSEEQILTDLRGIIASKRSLPLEHQIHAIWYSLNANKLRWEASQARFIRELSEENIPILLVLTQVRRKSDGSINPEVTKVIEAIRQDDLPLRPQNRVFPTMAQDDEWDDARAHGLQELLDATFQVAPEGVQNALNAAQRIDLPRKAAQARSYVQAAAAAAAIAGASPIPFSDAGILVPIQTGMMAKVAAIFGLGLRKGTLATLDGAAFTAGGVTQLGKYVVTSLLKFVPVAGTMAGGVIRAGVASSLTYAIGEAWIAVCTQLHRMGPEAAANVPTDEIRELFMTEFKKSARKSR